jgi:hypothetical protein
MVVIFAVSNPGSAGSILYISSGQRFDVVHRVFMRQLAVQNIRKDLELSVLQVSYIPEIAGRSMRVLWCSYPVCGKSGLRRDSVLIDDSQGSKFRKLVRVVIRK